MKKNFAIVGGDLRLIKLAKMLEEDGNNVTCFGLEESQELKENVSIVQAKTLKEAINKSDIIIGPVPFTSNEKDISTPFSKEQIHLREFMHVINAKILIAGNIPPEVYKMANDEYVEIVDLMKREELAVLNTIATAEGTISEAILNTNKILHGSKVLILGFGRIGKVLARKLVGLSAIVTCAARKDEDFAWIKAYGFNQTNINKIGANLGEYDIIINTVPQIILNEDNLKYVKKDCLLIDLASNPGGIDKKEVKKENLKLVWALALPGKIAPITSAEFIKETIYNIIKNY